ncbi:reverse transcriptase domain-containing protein [Tanacetum coccineum]
MWDDPYLFKSGPDRIIRRCVFRRELQEILEHCHMGPAEGHYGADITTRKGWEYLFPQSDAFNQYFAGMISEVSRMLSMSFKRFISCGMLCANTSSDTYIATTDSVVQKRRCIVKQGPCKDLYRLGIDSDIIRYMDNERQPLEQRFNTIIGACGQIKNTNRAIKRILERTVNGNRKEWADKLDDALWAFRTAYKSPIKSTPFRNVYGKACHLPIEIEHKAYWALRNAYENSHAYKERTKRWHDAKMMYKEFHEGEEILVFNSRLKLFPRKLKSRWYGPYTVSKVFPYGTIEVCGSFSKEAEFEVISTHNHMA